MLKKIRPVLVLMLALVALFMLPTLGSAHEHDKEEICRESFVFTAKDNKSHKAVTGGLTIDIRKGGQYDGMFTFPDNTQIPVSGSIHHGKVEITFYSKENTPIVKGKGDHNKLGVITGTYWVPDKNGKKVESGKWSAFHVDNTKEVHALAFTGKVVEGKSKGDYFAGAIVLDKDTHHGYFLQADGSVVHVHAKYLKGKEELKIVFHGLTIVACGTLVENPKNPQNQGYEGYFDGPEKHDSGKWSAFYFHF